MVLKEKTADKNLVFIQHQKNAKSNHYHIVNTIQALCDGQFWSGT